MSGVIRWERPPASPNDGPRQRRVKPCRHEATAAELRQRPGVWGVVYEGEPGPASGLASNIGTGATKSFRPAGAFDAVSRKRGDVTVVYARYVGDGGQP